jgi:hypothetical protein
MAWCLVKRRGNFTFTLTVSCIDSVAGDRGMMIHCTFFVNGYKVIVHNCQEYSGSVGYGFKPIFIVVGVALPLEVLNSILPDVWPFLVSVLIIFSSIYSVGVAVSIVV